QVPPATPSDSGAAMVPSAPGIRVATPPGASLDIPDAVPEGVRSELQVTTEGRVGTLSVHVDIQHSAVDDLRMDLAKPGGSRVRLHDQQSGSADLVTTYSTDQTPAMAGLVGTAVQGTWALEVADLVRKDQGRLRGWSIELGLQAAAGPALRGETA